MPEGKQSTSRLRRWLDKRRESQRRAGEIAQRRKAQRKHDTTGAARHGGTFDPRL
jgi:hypothetical protein